MCALSQLVDRHDRMLDPLRSHSGYAALMAFMNKQRALLVQGVDLT